MKRQARAEAGQTECFAKSANGDNVDFVTLDLLAKWRLQDAMDNPEQIGAAEREVTAFKKAMNEARALAGQPLIYP
jgi:hypothetical protein